MRFGRSAIAISALTLAIASQLTQAQEMVVGSKGLPLKIEIKGSGAWACAAEDALVLRPVIGRGATQDEAEKMAKANCQNTNRDLTDYFCRITDCELDATPDASTVHIRTAFTGSSVIISAVGPLKFSCGSTHSITGITYVAMGPTQLEARALAQTVCAIDSSSHISLCHDDGCKLPQGPAIGGARPSIVDLIRRRP